MSTRTDDGSGTRVDAEADDGCLLDVDLLNWANEWVGKPCLRCETEVRYVPLGVTELGSQHRIECECMVIESVAKR